MIKKIILITGIVSMVFILPLWSKAVYAWDESSRLAMDYGTSFKLAKFNHIFNPEAEKNLDPVTGLSGKEAQKGMEKYLKSFEETAPQQAIMPASILSSGIMSSGR